MTMTFRNSQDLAMQAKEAEAQGQHLTARLLRHAAAKAQAEEMLERITSTADTSAAWAGNVKLTAKRTEND